MNPARSRSSLETAPKGARVLIVGAWLACNCTINDDVVARHLTNSSSGGSPGVGGSQAGGSQAGGGQAGGGQAGGSQGGGEPNSQAGADGVVCSEPTFVSTATTSGDAADRCAGWAARRSFSHALCVCSNARVPSVLATAASDSSSNAGPPRGSAAIGINGSFRTTEYLNVDGSVTIAGGVELSSSGGFDIAGDLRLAGPAAAAGPIFIGRDAWLVAATSSLSLVEVARDLHLGPDGTLTSFGPVRVGGERFDQPIAVAPPCGCADGELLDRYRRQISFYAGAIARASGRSARAVLMKV